MNAKRLEEKERTRKELQDATSRNDSQSVSSHNGSTLTRRSKEHDSAQKDHLQKLMQKEVPFFLTKAQVVLTQDKSALEAKTQSVVENARLRFERQLLAERQKDLDHQNQDRLSSQLYALHEQNEKQRKQEQAKAM